MSTDEVLREYAARTGWDLAAMLAILLEYIDSIDRSGRGEDFRAYVHARAMDEIAMSNG